MRLAAVLSVCFILLAAGISGADFRSIPLKAGENRLDVQQLSQDELRFRIEVRELATLEVKTKAGAFTRLFLPGFHSSQVEGAPQLPMMNRLVAMPYGASARIEVEASESRIINLSDYGVTNLLMPAQPSMPKSADPESWPFVFDRSAYQVDKVAQELVKLLPQGRLRAMDLGRLEVSPVEYFPQTNQIRVTESIDFRVVFEGADHANGEVLKNRTASPFFDPVYAQVAGSRDWFHDDYPDRVQDVVTMVIITPPEYEAQLQDFVAWKIERGFHMVIGVIGSPEVGATTSSIQAYIHDLYNNPPLDQPAPSFALFMGDVALCPTFMLSGDATDRPYCAVDADLVPDIYYGRFSFTNPTQLQYILDKTMMYDQFTLPDPSYLGEVVMIAGMDAGHGATWGNGQINYGTTYYFNAAHGIFSHTYLYPESGSNAANIIQNVSDGVAYINYTAHGNETSWSNPGFTIANINSLQNDGKYCLAVGNCCLTSAYDYGECFAEAFLRAEEKGAIGYIGGSNSTYWDEDYWWGVGYTANIIANPTYENSALGAYDGLFHDHGEADHLWYVTNDAIIFCGNLAVMESGSSLTTYYWNIYNLMGDPSLSTYLGVPSANVVSHPATVFNSDTAITISAEHGSYVGLTQSGNLVGAGTVDASGNVTIEFLQTPLTPGVPLHMVVMAQNREPYVADLNVIPPATVTFTPTMIQVNTPTDVTVTVLDASGENPLPGIDVWVEGLDYTTTPVPTDTDGIAVIAVDYQYGPQIDIVGQDPAETYRLFTKMLRVNALPLTAPDLTVTTDIGLVDAFALNLPGTMHATVGETGHTLYAELPDGTLLSTQDPDLTFTPHQLGEVNGYIAVSGYNYYWESFDIIEAYGTLTGTVSSGGSPLPGVTLQGYDTAMEMVFEVVTNASGDYDVGEEILVADYTIVIDHFGNLHYEEPFFLNYGANIYDITLTPAPSGVLTGTVTEVGTGDPLQATVKVFRTDTGELYTETVSDPIDGSYTTSALPYFDYEVKVRAFHHIPVTITITIDQPVVEKYFVLEITAGDILVVDDGAKSRPVPVKYDRKGQSIIAQPYVTQDSKTATDIIADLEELGYYATLEDVNVTDPATWQDYDLVICCSSNNTSPLPNQATRNALVNFVNAGGHLLIEGGEVAWAHYSSDPAFCATVLHITGWNHDSSGNLTVVDPDHYAMSVPNQIASINFSYNGYGDQDAVDVASDADRIGSWTSYPNDGSVIAYDPNPAPEGGQIVFFAFNYSAAAGDGRQDLLENTVLWLITPEFGTASVSGTVTLYGEDDHSGVLVQALPNGSSMVTGTDGTYTLPGLFNGEYMIIATKQGWATDSEIVTLEVGEQVTDVDFVLTPTSQVEVWDAPGLSIPDNNPIGVSSAVEVTIPGIVTAVEVFVDITHTYIGDLIVELTAPDGGTTVRLHNRTGDTTENIYGWYPTELIPAESLDGFIGVEMLGSWTLHVSDHAGWDTGSLNEWCLRVTYGSPVSPIGEDLLPTVLALGDNFPNPFNPQTKISFDLPVATPVDLAVYDVSGRRVTTLVAEVMPAGRHFTLWNGTDSMGQSVSSGVYFYRMIAGGEALTGKMMLLK